MSCSDTQYKRPCNPYPSSTRLPARLPSRLWRNAWIWSFSRGSSSYTPATPGGFHFRSGCVVRMMLPLKYRFRKCVISALISADTSSSHRCKYPEPAVDQLLEKCPVLCVSEEPVTDGLDHGPEDFPIIPRAFTALTFGTILRLQEHADSG